MGIPGGFAYDVDERGTVTITHHGRPGTLRGGAAARFLTTVEKDDPQLVMAKATGNYKHGNERQARNHARNRGR